MERKSVHFKCGGLTEVPLAMTTAMGLDLIDVHSKQS